MLEASLEASDLLAHGPIRLGQHFHLNALAISPSPYRRYSVMARVSVVYVADLSCLLLLLLSGTGIGLQQSNGKNKWCDLSHFSKTHTNLLTTIPLVYTYI